MIWWQEVIGYLGMVFLVTSFFFKNIKMLRIINMIGGCICCVYGFLTNTIATAVLNITCITINLIQLILYYKKKDTKQEDK